MDGRQKRGKARRGEGPREGSLTAGPAWRWSQVTRHLTPQDSLSSPSPGDVGKESLRLTGKGRGVMLKDKSRGVRGQQKGRHRGRAMPEEGTEKEPQRKFRDRPRSHTRGEERMGRGTEGGRQRGGTGSTAAALPT